MAVSREWANQKSFLRKVYNREVNEWFRDIAENELLDNSTARKQAKKACLIQSKDSQNMSLIKMLSFRHLVQQTHLITNCYGIPIDSYQETVKFRPQVHLFFRQDSSAVSGDRRPVEGQISFRLINETSATMSETKARLLATKIKNEFALNNGYMWKKGKLKCVYKDFDNGLDLSILSLSEAEGKEVINKVIDVVGVTYNENYLRISEPKRNSETNPTTSSLVYGKQRKNRRWRPIANVRFRYAVLTIHGMQHRIILVDRSKTFLDALEWA